MDGVAYLPVGAVQRRYTDFPTEIRLRSAVFLPIEAARGDTAAKPFEVAVVSHSAPPLLTSVSWPRRSGNQYASLSEKTMPHSSSLG